METKAKRKEERNWKEVKHKTIMKTNLKDDMNYRSKRDEEDQRNRFKPLSDENDSDSFWSEDIIIIKNRKENKKEND